MKLQSDGIGRIHLYQKAGGSVWHTSEKTVENREHFIYQKVKPVFKWAVSKMADTAVEVMERNGHFRNSQLSAHQANLKL